MQAADAPANLPERRHLKPLESFSHFPEAQWLQHHFPSLRKVAFLISLDDTFIGGRFLVPDRNNRPPQATILLAQSTPEQFLTMKKVRKTAITSMANLLHLSFEEMTGEIIRSFIIFHEAGHALDYFEHFYFPLKEDEDIANVAWKHNSSLQFETLPVPCLTPRKLQRALDLAGGFSQWLEANPQIKEKCEKENITSGEKLYQLQELAYRALPKENCADVFAAKYFPIFVAEKRGPPPEQQHVVQGSI
jgi:hypothetical protein